MRLLEAIVEANQRAVAGGTKANLNTPQFAGPNATLGAAGFGRISGTVLNNREMQFGLKYVF